MKEIYILLVILNFIVILLKNKKINFLMVYYVSSVIYYFNLLIGKLYESYQNIIYSYDINEGTYVVHIINMVIILICSFIPEINVFINRKEDSGEKDEKNTELEAKSIKAFSIFCFIFMLYIILKFDLLFGNSSFNKTEILNNTGTLVEYFKFMIMFVAIYLFTQEGIKYSKIYYIFVICELATTFLLGHRSFIIITFIAIVMNYLNKKLQEKENLLKYLLKNYKIVIFIILVITITFSIKGVTAALFDGNFELVFERLTNPSYYLNTIKISEPNVITNNLNAIIQNNYQVDHSSYFTLITLFIPFISRYIDYTSFTYIYQWDLFGVDNRASTFIGEAFANGGYLMVIIIVAIVVLFLKFLNSKYNKTNNNLIRTFILVTGVDMAFYIHRNSMDYVLIRIRSYIYILILIYLIQLVYKACIKRK